MPERPAPSPLRRTFEDPHCPIKVGPENRSGARKGSAVTEKTAKHNAHAGAAEKGRSDPPRKSQSPICAAEYFRPLHKLIGVESVRKIETGLERGRWLSRKLRNTVLMHSMRRGDPPRKSSSLIRAAECFRPLRKFKGVESVRKTETGLKRGQRLSRKLRNTVLMHSMRRGDPPRKSSSPIRGAEYFLPLHKLIGVKSVRKIETGLERGRWLSR